LTPAVSSWRARRQAIADLFDDTTSAVLIAQTSRFRQAGGAVFETVDWGEKEKQEFIVRMDQASIERWLQAQNDARVALSRIERFVPEIREQIANRWEIYEDQELVIRELIDARRDEAIRSERLFRSRRPQRRSA